MKLCLALLGSVLSLAASARLLAASTVDRRPGPGTVERLYL